MFEVRYPTQGKIDFFQSDRSAESKKTSKEECNTEDLLYIRFERFFWKIRRIEYLKLSSLHSHFQILGYLRFRFLCL